MRILRAMFDCLLVAAAAFFLVFYALGCAEPNPVAPANGDDDNNVTEPSVPQEYQFGAKFEPPVGRVVHAVGQWKSYNEKYFSMLGPALQPASELIFIPIADTLRPWQPLKISESMNTLAQAGRIPSLDIGLRGNQPTQAELAQMADPLFGVDDEVAHSTNHDSRLQDLVNIVKQHKRPVMIRIGGEFNGWWNGYHPYDYPRAFRKIVNMFRAAGAYNAAFIWCYEPAAANDFDAQNAQGEYKWFPGSDVIDWFSIDLFNQEDVSGSLVGHTGAISPFGKTIRFLDMAVAQQKPVVIAESSPSHYNFADAAQATNAWAQWFTPYFALISSRSEIKWFHYINYDWLQASYYAATGWTNNDLTVSASLSAQYVAELSKPKYLHSGEKSLLKDFDKYK